MSIASNQTHFDNIQHYVQQHLIQAPCCRSTNIVRGWSNIKVKYDGIYFEIQQKKSSSKKKLTKLIWIQIIIFIFLFLYPKPIADLKLFQPNHRMIIAWFICYWEVNFPNMLDGMDLCQFFFFCGSSQWVYSFDFWTQRIFFSDKFFLCLSKREQSCIAFFYTDCGSLLLDMKKKWF